MAFVKATIEIKPASVGTGIKASLRKGKATPALLTLSVKASIATKLNIGAGDMLEVLIGDGEHHGLVRLRKNNSIGIAKAEARSTGKGDFFLIRLGYQPAFVDRSETSAWCQWETLDDGWAEIVLPRWAEDTAPRRKSDAVAGKPAIAAVAPLKQSVTAGLMGDPPAGRREMLERVGKIASKAGEKR